MSEQNAEMVREAIRRFEASEFDEASSSWHPDASITGPEGWPERGPFEGREAVFAQFERLAADWGEHRISDVEVIADQAGWVVVTFRWEVEGGKSGAATTADLAAAYRVVDSLIREAHFRWTREEALEAAGLRE
jgi:ketosteroid isomerase-like protein